MKYIILFLPTLFILHYRQVDSKITKIEDPRLPRIFRYYLTTLQRKDVGKQLTLKFGDERQDTLISFRIEHRGEGDRYGFDITGFEAIKVNGDSFQYDLQLASVVTICGNHKKHECQLSDEQCRSYDEKEYGCSNWYPKN